MVPDSRPWLLLDVDGVLNPYVSNSQAKKRGLVRRRAEGLPGDRKMHLDPALVPHLHRASQDFRLAWASWRDLPARTLNPWLALDVPTVHFDYHADSASKVPGILRFVGGTPFVWVDDDVTDFERESLDREHPSPHLVITPDPEMGMTDADVQAALSWTGGL